jgi:hypothetical protein
VIRVFAARYGRGVGRDRDPDLYKVVDRAGYVRRRLDLSDRGPARPLTSTYRPFVMLLARAIYGVDGLGYIAS